MSFDWKRSWLLFAVITTVFWGVWGAIIELPEKRGLPSTLGYVVWSLTMIPCALAALHISGARVERDRRSILRGVIIGVTGSGGQLALFEALKDGPAFIVFPVVSLYPVVTILMSLTLLKERAPPRHWLGIALAVPAIIMLSYVKPGDDLVHGSAWLLLAMAVFLSWGVQGWAMKLANETMSAEGIFAYMAASGVTLAPIALAMTDFGKPIAWEMAPLAAGIHVLNSLGALSLVYALRYGKAIIVVPMTALAPVITIALSLAIYGRLPLPVNAVGMALALLAIALMAV